MVSWKKSGALAGLAVAALSVMALAPEHADSMCCYFRPIIVDVKNPTEILQPSQVALITWDADKQIETVTVQPRFEGNARDFGMVIPTPSQPKLDEMPRDFFKALATFTTAKKREFPQSRFFGFGGPEMLMNQRAMPAAAPGGLGGGAPPPRPTTVEVLEVGLVGNLDYKIISAGRPDDLFTWLKDNKYQFAGDEATLDHYVKRKYFFTVMKIDTLQMKRNADGSYTGDVTPTRFTFKSDKLVYPLKITQPSVKDKTSALFYVLSKTKMDLTDDLSYQFNWLSMLKFVESNMGAHDMTKSNRDFLSSLKGKEQDILKRAGELGFTFQFDGGDMPFRRPFIRPQPVDRPKVQKSERSPTTLEWAKKLTDEDIQIVAGTRAFSETVPDPDDGFTQADLRDPRMQQAVFKVIQQRMAKFQKDRPRGYLVRKASAEDLKTLPLLKGHLQPGMYLTKFQRSFNKNEMNEDLEMVEAKVANIADTSEHEEVLRAQMFGGRGFRGLDLPPAGGGPGGVVPLPAPAIPRAPQAVPDAVPGAAPGGAPQR